MSQRLLRHNETSTKGYTLKYRPWEVAIEEKYSSRAEALNREKALKSGQGRQWIWEELAYFYQSML